MSEQTPAMGSPAAQTRTPRWLRLAKAALVPALLVWCGHYAYTRWTTPAAALSRGDASRYALRDRTLPYAVVNLQSAVLRPSVALTGSRANSKTSASPLFWAGFEFGDWLKGDWDPSRAEIAAAVTYLTDPRVAKALDDLVAWYDENPDTWAGASDSNPSPTVANTAIPAGAMGVSSVPGTNAAGALIARARYRAAAQNDLPGALADLRYALRIEREDLDSNARAGGWNPFGPELSETVVIHELGCLAQEFSLPPETARSMIAYLRDQLPMTVSQSIRASRSMVDDVEKILDRYYTDDCHGNGWMVLATAPGSTIEIQGETVRGRGRIWNLLSGFYYDRAAMRKRLTSFIDQVDALDHAAPLEPDPDTSRMVIYRSRRGGEDVRDGVLIGRNSQRGQGMSIDSQSVQTACNQVCWRRATILMLALSAYRHDHNEFPAALSDLSPVYIDEIPLDPFLIKPFAYERQRASFRLTDHSTTHTYNWIMTDLPYQRGTYQPQREAN